MKISHAVLFMIIVWCCGLVQLSKQDETQVRSEALDSLLKDTQSSLLEIANALVELEVSIQALKDAPNPDLKTMLLKKDHQQEMLQIQTSLQSQLQSFEAKAGYKAGSTSCASIASQLKNNMKEGQYWIYPVQKPMRVRCKNVNNAWTALSLKGTSSNPDYIVGTNPSTGIFSADGSKIGVSIDGVETTSTNSQGFKVNGKLEASSYSISGQAAFTQVLKFENRLNFTKGEWFTLLGGTVTDNLSWSTFICSTHWHSPFDGYWLMDHSYLISWVPVTNSHDNASPINIPISSSTHEADTVSIELRFKPHTGQVPPSLDMKIDGTHPNKRNGVDVLFTTRCLNVLPH